MARPDQAARSGSARILAVALAALGLLALALFFALRRGGSSEGVALAPDSTGAADGARGAALVAGDDVGGRSVEGNVQLALPDGIAIPAGVRISGPGRLAGRVLDRASGAAVAGARVDLLPLPPGGGQFLGRILRLAGTESEVGTRVAPLAITGTDASGAFRFEGVRAGEYFIEARAARAVPDNVAMARVLASGEGGPVDLWVRSGGRVLGVVLRPDGEPASGARVALTPGAGVVIEAARNGDVAWLEGACDSHGRFVIAGVPPGGGWELTASGGGVALTHLPDIVVQAGADTEVVVHGRRGGSIAGRILSAPGSTEDAHAARTPLAGAHVGAVPRGLRDLAFVEEVLESTHAITDADGRFSMTSVPAGEVDVLAIAPGHLPGKGPNVWVVDSASAQSRDFELARGALVRGRVVDSAGAPLEGVQVRWNMIDMNRFEFDFTLAPMLAQAVRGFEYPRTDVDGRFEAGPFGGKPPHRLEFWKVGYKDARASWDPGKPGDLDVVLVRGGSVEGVVMDAKKHVPVTTFSVSGEDRIDTTPGAPGRQNPWAGGEPFEDPAGRFHVDSVEPGKVRLTFRAKGFVEETVEEIEVKEGEITRGVIVELTPGATLSGRVVDSEGKPIAGARVFATVDVPPGTDTDASEGRRARRRRGGEPFGNGDMPPGFADFAGSLGLLGDRMVESDAEGRFVLAGVEPGLATMFASHREYCPARSDPIAVESGGAGEAELVLRKGGGLFGKAIDRFRRPVPGAIVIAVSPGNIEGSATGGAVYQGHTDAEGAYRIEHMVAGGYFLVLTRGDEALNPMSFLGTLNFDLVSVPSDDMLEYDILDSSSGAAHVFGTVRAGGEPVESGAVIAMSFEGENMLGVDFKMAQIRSGGTYDFVGLAPGEYRLQLTGVRMQGQNLEAELTVEIPDLPEVRMDLAMPEGAIEGRVLDAASHEPVAGAQLRLRRTGGSTSSGIFGRMISEESGKREQSDANGTFRFEHLQAGEWDLAATSPHGGESGRYAPAPAQVVRVGEDRVAGGVEVLLEPALAIEGTVTDAAGQPLADVTLVARPHGDQSLSVESDRSDENGRFRIDYLGEGVFDVVATAEGFAEARVREHKLVREGAKPLAIVLQHGVQVKVKVVGAGGTPLSGAAARLIARGAPSADPLDAAKVMENLFSGKAVTGDDGLLELGQYAPGAYTLEVRRGLASTELQVEVPDQPECELHAALR